MRPLRRLLHLLLALAVAANAAGPALASGHDCCAKSERVATATATAASAAMPCHDMAEAAATPPKRHAGHAAPPSPVREDGCGHGHAGAAGGCACALQATTLLPTLPSWAPAPMRTATIAFVAHARAAPPLPHPLRPPIHAG